jgi:hypothetical protein
MRRLVVLALPVTVLVTLALYPRQSAATPEYARRTRKECLYCHPKDSWSLNDAGKYYREHKSLQGFKAQPGQ